MGWASRASKGGTTVSGGQATPSPRPVDDTPSTGICARRKLPVSNSRRLERRERLGQPRVRPARSATAGRRPPRRNAAIPSRSSTAGGVQHSRRSRSGCSRFSAGTDHCVESAATASRATPSRAAAAGSFSAQARGGGGASLLGPRTEGRALSGSARARSIACCQSAARRRVPLPAKAGSAVSSETVRGRAWAAATIAWSGRTRPGEMSRCRAFWSRVSQQLAHDAEAAGVTDRVQPGDPAPRLDPRRRQRRGADRLELLGRPLGLAGDGQPLGQDLAQLDEHLDVERGVAEPLGRQRARGPVDGGVLLGQTEAEGVGDDGREPDPLHPQEPGAELGVEHAAGQHALLGQPGQVLGRRVQHPLDAHERPRERRQVGHGDRVDQCGPGALAADLDQVRALAVAVAGRALGVHGDRAGARAERSDDGGQCLRGLDDRAGCPRPAR